MIWLGWCHCWSVLFTQWIYVVASSVGERVSEWRRTPPYDGASGWWSALLNQWITPWHCQESTVLHPQWCHWWSVLFCLLNGSMLWWHRQELARRWAHIWMDSLMEEWSTAASIFRFIFFQFNICFIFNVDISSDLSVFGLLSFVNVLVWLV